MNVAKVHLIFFISEEALQVKVKKISVKKDISLRMYCMDRPMVPGSHDACVFYCLYRCHGKTISMRVTS